ncbi:50S ribosomal protein L35ae [Candidatus Micrarchaeota archaeon]|nr:50S ribosomal protein L35ae [Candidatus Micrarchaeota archaeon]
MKATIVNYRGSVHSQKTSHMILLPEGVKTRKDADKLKGKEVIFTTESKKLIKGKIAAAHGSKGAVRAIFERGLPGQSLGGKVDIGN